MSFTYKGLEATYTRHRITDEELERQLERLRRQTPQVVPVTGRGAENGDTVELDYAGFCDGEPFAGGTAEHQTLVLGSGTFIPGFEEQLLGCRPGDKVTVRVTFPRPYHAEHLAGKTAEFRCAIHAVTRQSLHELGDDFARALGLDSLEELRRELRKSPAAGSPIQPAGLRRPAGAAGPGRPADAAGRCHPGLSAHRGGA